MKTSVAKPAGLPSSNRKEGAPSAILGSLTRRSIAWDSTGDINYPWKARIGDRTCTIRLNDFPAEPMYTLLEGSREIGDFDDWPKNWKRKPSVLSLEAMNELVREVVKRTGIPKKKAEAAVETVLEGPAGSLLSPEHAARLVPLGAAAKAARRNAR